MYISSTRIAVFPVVCDIKHRFWESYLWLETTPGERFPQSFSTFFTTLYFSSCGVGIIERRKERTKGGMEGGREERRKEEEEGGKEGEGRREGEGGKEGRGRREGRERGKEGRKGQGEGREGGRERGRTYPSQLII